MLKDILVSSTPEWEKMRSAAQHLYELDSEVAFVYFINLLNLDNKQSWSRNVAALMLREIKDDRAVKPLFEAVLKNKYYNGTLVYALETMDGGGHFRSLFDVLFHHGEEA
ncbi:MAG: lyase HEAT-like repeat domain protein, partial [Flavipsychrobacter sp.]|nr:lyase HEAT-like repeat domain protein [Flavipsychrobacter sp.]